MKTDSKALMLSIFISSTDKTGHDILSEHIVFKAKEAGIAGATVLKGFLGFGASSVIHSYKFWEVSEKVPTLVQIVDEESQVLRFFETIRPVLESTRYGCLVTTQQVNVLIYKSGNKKFLRI